MKKFFIILCSFLLISAFSTSIFADGERFDMTGWSVDALTSHTDQDEHVKVSRYISPNGKYAFCIEPNVLYKPDKYKYRSYLYDNETVFDLVKSFNTLDPSDDNLFIATQLLIWKEINNIDYTFDGYDYDDYKQIILNNIGKSSNTKKLLKANNQIKANLNEEITIHEDYSKYDVLTEGIEIINKDENGLTFKVVEKKPINKQIILNKPEDKTTNSYSLHSEGSQDLYYFDGEYSSADNKVLNILTTIQNPYISIKYSKKDLNGNNIKDAKFSLYQLDDTNGTDELIFININTDIDLYDLLLTDKNIYNNLSIEVSERYQKYLNSNIINTNELGYFSYKIYDNNDLICQGIVYVSDDINETNGIYKKYKINNYKDVYSTNNDINVIDNVDKNYNYYLCESNPAKGYEYVHKPCKLIETNTYNDETLEFLNTNRLYTLRLIKNNRNDIVLDGASFKITYYIDDEEKNIKFTTGQLNIDRQGNNKYLIYKYFDDIEVVEFYDDKYIIDNALPGKYYYYQSNSNEIDINKLNNNYTEVVDGGYLINNIPYSSKIIIEELAAPKGYIITEPVYEIYPDIEYSEITFSNYRVNEFEILPKKMFLLPKTCVEK